MARLQDRVPKGARFTRRKSRNDVGCGDRGGRHARRAITRRRPRVRHRRDVHPAVGRRHVRSARRHRRGAGPRPPGQGVREFVEDGRRDHRQRTRSGLPRTAIRARLRVARLRQGRGLAARRSGTFRGGTRGQRPSRCRDAAVQLRVGRRDGRRDGRAHHRHVHRTGALARHRGRFAGPHRSDRPGGDACHAGGRGRETLADRVPTVLATRAMAEPHAAQHPVRRRGVGRRDAARRAPRRHRHLLGPAGRADGHGARLRAEKLPGGPDPCRRASRAELGVQRRQRAIGFPVRLRSGTIRQGTRRRYAHARIRRSRAVGRLRRP